MNRAQAQTQLFDVRSNRSGLWSNRFLVWNFARRDLKGRFKGTALGWAWSLVLPLATVAIYSVVFSVFIRIEPPPMGNGDSGKYWLWLLTGMVAWSFILNATTQGIPSLLGSGPLLQKIFIPSFVPCLSSSIAIGVQSIIEVGILVTILIALGNVGLTWLLIPFWAVCLFIFTASTTYMLSVLNVFFRDVAQLVAVALQMIFFLTPIIYPLSMIPESWRGLPVRSIVEASPFTEFVQGGHALLYDLQMPGWRTVIAVLLWTGMAFAGATWVSRRAGRDVSEFI